MSVLLGSQGGESSQLVQSQRKYMHHVSDCQGVYWEMLWAWNQVVECPRQKFLPSSGTQRKKIVCFVPAANALVMFPLCLALAILIVFTH
jgi:hypothetical protein